MRNGIMQKIPATHTFYTRSCKAKPGTFTYAIFNSSHPLFALHFTDHEKKVALVKHERLVSGS